VFESNYGARTSRGSRKSRTYEFAERIRFACRLMRGRPGLAISSEYSRIASRATNVIHDIAFISYPEEERVPRIARENPSHFCTRGNSTCWNIAAPGQGKIRLSCAKITEAMCRARPRARAGQNLAKFRRWQMRARARVMRLLYKSASKHRAEKDFLSARNCLPNLQSL